MPRNFFYKLEVKFVLLTALIMAIAAPIVISLFLDATRDQLLNEATRRALLLTEATAVSFTNTLIYEEVGLVEEGGLMENHIAGLLKNRSTELSDVVVLSADGRTLAAHDYRWFHLQRNDPAVLRATRTTTLTIVPESKLHPRELDIIAPLQIGSKRFGTLIMHFSLENEYRSLAGFRNRLIGLTLVSLAAALLLAVIVAKTLARPIKHLAEEMAKITDINLTSDLKSTRRDEIGLLERGLLRMLQRLQQAAEERQKTQEALMQTEKLAALGTLVAGVSHEINNPLAGLYNCLRRIEAHPEDAQQTKKYAALMRKALGHIENTVQNLLNFSRQSKMVHKPVNLNETIIAALALVAYKLRHRGIEKRLHLAAQLPSISGDAAILEQLFVNLFLNAVDAMPAGGTLTITSGSNEDEVMVEVRDTGVGIPGTALGRIFDPFFTTKEVGQGTGLGLTLCKRFVTEHHGTIEVESGEGQGAVFRLRFPPLRDPASLRQSRICAAVLAGGKSSRMGKNKALLSLNGKTLIEHVTGAALAVTDFVQVITNSPKDYAFLKLPMLGDEIKDIGPLGGIYTALKNCVAHQCLIIACDLPFLSVELLRFLSENAGAADIFAVDAGKGVEPLCAVYSTTCLPAIEKQIAEKDYKVARLFERVEARIVRFHPGHSLYSDKLFYNVNTPEEFEELLV